MRNIAFYGGGSICELGPVSDVVLFFDCIRSFVVTEGAGDDWDLLTDRLYRRYLRDTEFSAALELMAAAKTTFDRTPSSTVEWNAALANDKGQSALDSGLPMLGQVFARFFEQFGFCIDSAKLFFEEWNIPQVVRIVISDSPAFLQDKLRTLSEYDALESIDKPFWQR